jgi:type I restriction enzyme S subunit
MEVRAGYKLTEVGVIPDSWDPIATSEIVDPDAPICYGVVQVGQHTNDGVPIVAIKYVKEIATAPLHRTAAPLERPYTRSRVRERDILISIKGTIGRVGIVPVGFEGNISRELARLRPRSVYSAEYIAHQLEAPTTQARIARTVVGTTRLEFSIAAVRQFELPIPKSLPEQRAIATVLSDVDALLGGLDRLVAKKRDLKQAAMQQLLTGQTRLPGFHGEWEVKQLDELGSCFAGGTPSTTRPDYWGGDVLWLPSGRVQNNILGEPSDSEVRITRRGLAESAAKRIKPHSVLVAITGATCANVALLQFEAAANQSVVAVEPFDGANASFLFYSLLMERAQILSRQSGSAQGGINLKAVKAITIRYPSPREQTAIAGVLSDMDAELSALEARRDKTRALKQGMMQELLTGRTRVAPAGGAYA